MASCPVPVGSVNSSAPNADPLRAAYYAFLEPDSSPSGSLDQQPRPPGYTTESTGLLSHYSLHCSPAVEAGALLPCKETDLLFTRPAQSGDRSATASRLEPRDSQNSHHQQFHFLDSLPVDSANCHLRETQAHTSPPRRAGQALKVDNWSEEHLEAALPAEYAHTESRFKQLASVHLLRATFQEERALTEPGSLLCRVLQTEQKRNSALKMKMGSLHQQLSLRLSIVEAQERRMAELLNDLDAAQGNAGGLAAHEQAVLHIVGDINDMSSHSDPAQLANTYWQAVHGMLEEQGWAEISDLPSFEEVCRAVATGRAATVLVRLSCGRTSGRPVSLQTLASLSREDFLELYKQYIGDMEKVLSLAAGYDPRTALPAQRRAAGLVKELSILRSLFAIGQPASYPPSWKQNARVIPRNALQAALEVGRLSTRQLALLWQLWEEHCLLAEPLCEEEAPLRAQLQHEIEAAAALPGAAPPALAARTVHYQRIMAAVARLSENQVAQANLALIFNTKAAFMVTSPLQLCLMSVAAAPYFLRFDLLFEKNLVPSLQF